MLTEQSPTTRRPCRAWPCPPIGNTSMAGIFKTRRRPQTALRHPGPTVGHILNVRAAPIPTVALAVTSHAATTSTIVIHSKEGIQGSGSPIKSGMTCKRNNPMQTGGPVGRGRARRSVLPRWRGYSKQNGGHRPPYDHPHALPSRKGPSPEPTLEPSPAQPWNCRHAAT